MKRIKIIIATTIFLFAFFVISGCSEKIVDPAVESLAICLSDSGAEFYGAYWCGHCEEQKEMFGSAWESLPYVECTKQQLRCEQAELTGYPTWKFADGRIETGKLSFAQLREYSGCE